jgi:hypothetical protein
MSSHIEMFYHHVHWPGSMIVLHGQTSSNNVQVGIQVRCFRQPTEQVLGCQGDSCSTDKTPGNNMDTQCHLRLDIFL